MSFFSSQIQVAIRVRPVLSSDHSKDSILYLNPNDDRKITIRKEESFYESYYDKIFPQDSTQKSIYQFIKPLIDDIQHGINATVFTYGQTGSGKTYTMFGSDWTDPIQALNYRLDQYKFIQHDLAIDAFSSGNGIIPRAINDIITLSEEFTINCSYIQIYNEKIYDLLEEEADAHSFPMPKFTTLTKDITSINPMKQKPLILRENKDSTHIEGLTEYPVETFYECLSLLKQGEKTRKKRQTLKNEMSSRSHTILILSLMSKYADNKGFFKKAKVHFCDLAGSEKFDSKATYIKYHFNEMVNINKSLSTLGNVIHALVNKKQHIPYRDSKLTQLLQHSLGGNTKTFLIANISPTKDAYEETMSTLKFADCVHSLFTRVEQNSIEPLNTNLVVQLTQELNAVKQLLNARRKKGTLGAIEEEVIQLREENAKLKKNSSYSNSTPNEQIEKLMKENHTLKSKLKEISSRNSTSNTNSNIGKECNCFVLTGNNIISQPSSNYHWKTQGNKSVSSEITTTNSRLKALEEMEYNSVVKMNKEIEMIKNKQNVKLFSKKQVKLSYL